MRSVALAGVDLAGGTIRVAESWDAKEGAIDPKTATPRRSTPVPGLLRDLLFEQRLRAGLPADDPLVFGEGAQPFHAASLYR